MTTHGFLACLVLLVFTTASCSTAMKVRSEDYGRIDADGTYRILTMDGHEYEATNLVVKDNVMTFKRDGELVSVPVDQIRLIQKINNNEVLTGAVVIGLVAALVAGVVLILQAD